MSYCHLTLILKVGQNHADIYKVTNPTELDFVIDGEN